MFRDVFFAATERGVDRGAVSTQGATLGRPRRELEIENRVQLFDAEIVRRFPAAVQESRGIDDGSARSLDGLPRSDERATRCQHVLEEDERPTFGEHIESARDLEFFSRAFLLHRDVADISVRVELEEASNLEGRNDRAKLGSGDGVEIRSSEEVIVDVKTEGCHPARDNGESLLVEVAVEMTTLRANEVTGDQERLILEESIGIVEYGHVDLRRVRKPALAPYEG